MTTSVNQGDSFTVGVGVSSAQRYSTLLAAALGRTEVNRGVSGAQAADMAFNDYNLIGDPASLQTILIGTNDAIKYKGDATKQGYYKRFLKCMALSALETGWITARGAMLATGAWGNTSVNTIGKYTDTLGDYIEGTFDGDTLYVQGILQDAASAGGIADVYIDAAYVGSMDQTGIGMSTQNGRAYAPAIWTFDAGGPGSHVVRITKANATLPKRRLYIDRISGNGAAASRGRLLVGQTPDMTAAAYTAKGISQAIIDQYTLMQAALVSDLVADGYDVRLADMSSFNPATDTQADGIHPDVSGQANLESDFAAVA